MRVKTTKYLIGNAFRLDGDSVFGERSARSAHVAQVFTSHTCASTGKYTNTLDYFHASDRKAALAALINNMYRIQDMYRICKDSITEQRTISNYVLVFAAQIREEGNSTHALRHGDVV